jgi:large subunit ribosomal protein L13
MTGRKMENEVFYWHTGHPGGVKEITPKATLAGKHPERLLERAVERMLKSGSDPAPSTSAEFLALMKAEYPRYAKLIKQANLRID